MKTYIRHFLLLPLCLLLTACQFFSPQSGDGFLTADLSVSDPAALAQALGRSAPLEAAVPGGARYRCVLEEDSQGEAQVTLDVSCDLDGDTLDFSLSGPVESVPYGENDTYYEGELTGTAAIRGADYTLSAGFQKLASADNVRVGLVLRPVLDEETAILLSFGKPVLTGDDSQF